MKPPEEIKKGLEGCGVLDGDCENCPYDDGPQLLCVDRLRKDALAYIQQLEAGIDHAEKVARECAKSITENLNKLQAKLFQLESDNESKQKRIEELESRLAQVERERNAAVRCLMEATKERAVCTGCRHDLGIDGRCEEADFDCKQCKTPCMCKTCKANSNYQWRGVCDDDTEDKE